MIVLHDNFNNKLEYNTFIALGSFDGLHAGHLSLIEKTVELAKLNNAKSMVNTFVNHPLTVIDKSRVPKIIMDNETKTEILKKLDIEVVNYADFDNNIMKMSSEDFISNTIKYYNAVGFVVGFNHRFGYKNLGDIELLKKLSIKLNFQLHIVEPIKYMKDVISSTRIRETIAEGDIKCANKMLLRPFSLKGEVVSGKKIGRTIGFPTANLNYNEEFILPKSGVYYTIVEYESNFYRGITDIGKNPTIAENNKTTIETYILDFNKDIYNENLKIYFIDRIRDEVKFDSLGGLIQQLDSDKNYAKIQPLELQ